MIAEPILAFFLIRYLRKTLRTSSALPEWDKLMTYTMVGIAVLFVIQQVFSTGAVTIWIWHILLSLIIGVMCNNRVLCCTKYYVRRLASYPGFYSCQHNKIVAG